MAFHDRQYQAYLVLGDPASTPLWSLPRWLEVAEAFDPVVARCRDKPLLRVTQYSKGENREVLKFGRLVWSRDSFEKWTHGSPTTGQKSELWDFFHVEVSAPSFPVSGREGRPPDLFFVVTNEGFIVRKTPLAFNPRVFVAIALDMNHAALEACSTAVRAVQRLTFARFSAAIRRPWGYPFGSTGAFQQAIQDLPHTGLFKVGQPHSRPLDLDTLSEKWEYLN